MNSLWHPFPLAEFLGELGKTVLNKEMTEGQPWQETLPTLPTQSNSSVHEGNNGLPTQLLLLPGHMPGAGKDRMLLIKIIPFHEITREAVKKRKTWSYERAIKAQTVIKVAPQGNNKLWGILFLWSLKPVKQMLILPRLTRLLHPSTWQLLQGFSFPGNLSIQWTGTSGCLCFLLLTCENMKFFHKLTVKQDY